MSKLTEASAGDPDSEVEVRVLADMEIISELSEDVKAGEEILTEAHFDEYTEDICVGISECGGHKKACITADVG